MADDTVTIRRATTLEEREVAREALPFFLNSGWEALKSDGSVNPSPSTTTAKRD